MLWFVRGEAQFRQAMLRLSEPADGQRVLDLCCGTGTLTLLIADCTNRARVVVGPDGSCTQLRVARDKDRTRRVGWLLADAQTVPLTGESFDRVTISAALLPRLQSRFDAFVSSLILGFFWWLWHLPAVFIPDRFMADNLLTFLALLGIITLTSVLFTWIYNNTNGSILAVILLHTAMHWAIWLAMPRMKMDLPTTGFMIGFLAVTVLIITKVWGAAQLSREEE